MSEQTEMWRKPRARCKRCGGETIQFAPLPPAQPADPMVHNHFAEGDDGIVTLADEHCRRPRLDEIDGCAFGCPFVVGTITEDSGLEDGVCTALETGPDEAYREIPEDIMAGDVHPRPPWCPLDELDGAGVLVRGRPQEYKRCRECKGDLEPPVGRYVICADRKDCGWSELGGPGYLRESKLEGKADE